MCLKKHPHSLKRSVHLQQSALSFFVCFLYCIPVCIVLLLSFSLSLSAIILSNIHAFFFFSMTKIPTLLSFVLLSQYLSVCSFPPGSLPLFHSLSHWLHPLTLSLSLSPEPPPLLRLLARLQCLTVTRLLFHLFSLFPPHIFSLLCLCKYVPLFRMTLSS